VVKRSVLKSRTPIKKVSDKRKREGKEYVCKRLDFLLTHIMCEVENCDQRATQIHHVRGRYKFYLDESTWMACCARCHTYIETNREWAKSKGYLIYGSNGK